MAKTLLTLNRHTGKSEEERSAAMSLLDLSLEPVVLSSGEPYEESMEEFEAEERDEFPDQELIESQISPKNDEKEVEDCSTQVSETLLKTEYLVSSLFPFFLYN